MRHINESVRVFSLFAISTALFATGGCTARTSTPASQIVQAGNQNLRTALGDKNFQFTVVSRGALRTQIESKQIDSADSNQSKKNLDSLNTFENQPSLSGITTNSITEQNNTSLIFGLPFNLLNKPILFGAVITKVSDSKSEDLGALKLTDIAPLQVKLVPQQIPADPENGTPATKVLAFINCEEDCSNIKEPKSLIEIPVAGVDNKNKKVMLDLAGLGEGLDIAALYKGHPSIEKFQSKFSKTTKIEYSDSTLIFDVETHLIDANADPENSNVPETIITNRWYLRLENGLSPSFSSRGPTEGVGFFLTERSKTPHIQRWDFDQRGKDEGIKYYVKHVPTEFQPAFASAFDEWNEKLLPIIGKKVFSYEFIPEGDPRNDLYVAGDVRYNILEWDLNNVAPYGGLGPSIAQQYTGEIFHANVLVQGPNIVNLYTKWFNAYETAKELQLSGEQSKANAFLAQARREIKEQTRSQTARKFKVKLSKNLMMRVRSQELALEDPLQARDDFDVIPDGYTFETYMPGYFHDMVAHELGHNLGLRHNFKGNLGAKPGTPTYGGVSRSVMEYLGRGYRYLDHIGDYDLMAISYGYAGISPSHTDWFCTDEDAASLSDPSKSAECTPEDATNDPFSYFLGRLSRSVDLLTHRGLDSDPEWTVSDMEKQLKNTLTGLGTYALSAPQTASTWTTFFNGGDRPRDPSGVKPYTLKKLKEILCDSSIPRNEKTQANLDALQEKVTTILKPVFSEDELRCSN